MVEVPLVPLGNLLRESPRNGLSPRPSDAPPGLPILRISAATSRQDGIVDEADYKYLEVCEREALQYRVQPGDLLACRFNGNLRFVGRFALYRGYLGKHQIYPDKLVRFRVDTARVLPEFVLLMINSRPCRSVIESFCSTTAGNIGISAANLKTVPIPVPPLHEQRRIVERIEELSARIERARGLRREAVNEMQSVVSLAVAETLATLPMRTERVTVADVAQSVTDGDHQPPPKSDAGIPFIFISNINKGHIDFSGCSWVPADYFASLSPARLPQRGDVLYSAVGTYGIPCVVDTEAPFCFQRHIAIIKPDRKRILSRYLAWALSSSDVFDQATRAATGSTHRTVPLRAIRNLRFPLPSLQEQHRAVTYLDGIRAKANTVKRLQAESVIELDALLPAVLNKAFEGGL
jgi:Type I restriction modification DNA specificity domain